MKEKVRGAVLLASTKETFNLGVNWELWRDSETGKEKVYVKYTLPDVVQVMGVTPDGKIIAIREFQPGVGADYLHLVGETLEPNEGPLAAASRGLLEETGYQARSLGRLSAILENSGRSDRKVYLVLATDCEKVAEGEKGIKVELFSPSEFWRIMRNYFLYNPQLPHGGGNTLKLMALAYDQMGWLNVQKES